MNDLGIDTSAMVPCGHPGCRWLLVPDSPCPEHSDSPPVFVDPDDPVAVEEAKRQALEEMEISEEREHGDR